MELINYIDNTHVITFLLLLIRFASIMILFPFFSHTAIPATVKGALTLYLTFLFLPLVAPSTVPADISSLSVAILSEIFFGIISGFLLQLSFYIISYAGEHVAFVMGFTMASVFDPQTGTQSQIVSKMFSLFALLVLLITDAHHAMLNYIYYAINMIPLGGFVFSQSLADYAIMGVSHMFIMGFSMAFPIIALSLLSDVIFGMLMKTMPQFNLLVVGFPIKIILAFSVLIATFGGILILFKQEFQKVLIFLNTII